MNIRISWGVKIAMLYGGFVVLILSLVIGTNFRKSELIADDYYQQELTFQQKIDAAAATAALKESIMVSSDAASVLIKFPEAFNGQGLTGSIHFYAPSSAKADRIIPVQSNNGVMTVGRNKLAAAVYEVQISWSANGKSYYQSVPLNLLHS